MQEFTSSAGRHSFTMDGREYYIPSPNIQDVETVGALSSMTTVEQTQGMRDILVKRAAPAKLTFWERITNRNPAPAAVDSLGLPQTTQLFTAWIVSLREVSLGESSGSAE
jgi:hypothetical protein